MVSVVTHVPAEGEAEAPPELIPDLDEKELYLVGRLVVGWALVEHTVYELPKAMNDASGAQLDGPIRAEPWPARLAAFESLVRLIQVEHVSAKYQAAIEEMKAIAPQRHNAAHGLWDWPLHNPDGLIVSRSRPPKTYVETVDAGLLEDLCRRIGRVAFDLSYPGGLQQFRAKLFEAGGSFSRDFMRTNIRRSPPAGGNG